MEALRGAERPEDGLTTTEVALLVGVTYRQLDYWLRTGAIEISDPTPGTGFSRTWTEADIERLRCCVAVYQEATETIEAFRSGRLWKEHPCPSPK